MKTNIIQKQVDEALSLTSKGREKLAESKIKELYRQHPDNPFVLFAMGVIHFLKKDYEATHLYLDKAIAIDPDYIEAWFNKAVTYQSQLEVGKMLKTYLKVVDIGSMDDPIVKRAFKFINETSANIKKEFGLSLKDYMRANDKFDEAFTAFENGQWEEALKDFKESLSINPKSAQSYGNMGICLAKLGRKTEALEALDAALKIDPDYAPAINNRIVVNRLNEGEILGDNFATMNFYKDLLESRKRSENKK